jgi:hypothetical protein
MTEPRNLSTEVQNRSIGLKSDVSKSPRVYDESMTIYPAMMAALLVMLFVGEL